MPHHPQVEAALIALNFEPHHPLPSPGDIRSRYKQLAFANHPDKHPLVQGTPEQQATIKNENDKKTALFKMAQNGYEFFTEQYFPRPDAFPGDVASFTSTPPSATPVPKSSATDAGESSPLAQIDGALFLADKCLDCAWTLYYLSKNLLHNYDMSIIQDANAFARLINMPPQYLGINFPRDRSEEFRIDLPRSGSIKISLKVAHRGGQWLVFELPKIGTITLHAQSMGGAGRAFDRESFVISVKTNDQTHSILSSDPASLALTVMGAQTSEKNQPLSPEMAKFYLMQLFHTLTNQTDSLSLAHTAVARAASNSHHPIFHNTERTLPQPMDLPGDPNYAINQAIAAESLKNGGLKLMGIAGGNADQKRNVILNSDGTCTAEFFNHQTNKVETQDHVQPNSLRSQVARELYQARNVIVVALGLTLPEGHQPHASQKKTAGQP